MTYMSAVNCCQLLSTAVNCTTAAVTRHHFCEITISWPWPQCDNHIATWCSYFGRTCEDMWRLYQQNLLHIRLSLLTGPSKPQGKPHSTIYVCRIATHASSCDKKLEVSRVDRVSSAAEMGRSAPEKVCTTLTWAISGMICGRSQFLKNARKGTSDSQWSWTHRAAVMVTIEVLHGTARSTHKRTSHKQCVRGTRSRSTIMHKLRKKQLKTTHSPRSSLSHH